MSVTLILTALGVIGLVIRVLIAWRAGRRAQVAKETKARLEAMHEEREIRNEVEDLPDDERRKLAARYVRKHR